MKEECRKFAIYRWNSSSSSFNRRDSQLTASSRSLSAALSLLESFLPLFSLFSPLIHGVVSVHDDQPRGTWPRSLCITSRPRGRGMRGLSGPSAPLCTRIAGPAPRPRQFRIHGQSGKIGVNNLVRPSIFIDLIRENFS